MRTLKWMVLLGLLLCGGALAGQKQKFAIILHAGAETNEGLARAVHAVVYSKELLEAGHEVVLIFDGAGTGWANQLRDSGHKFHKEYMQLEKLGIVEEVCDYCAEVFEVKEKLKNYDDVIFSADYEGHPSLQKWIGRGYQLIVL